MSFARRIVLDASVGVKWFRNEPGSAEAAATAASRKGKPRSFAVSCSPRYA